MHKYKQSAHVQYKGTHNNKHDDRQIHIRFTCEHCRMQRQSQRPSGSSRAQCTVDLLNMAYKWIQIVGLRRIQMPSSSTECVNETAYILWFYCRPTFQMIALPPFWGIFNICAEIPLRHNGESMAVWNMRGASGSFGWKLWVCNQKQKKTCKKKGRQNERQRRERERDVNWIIEKHRSALFS